MQTEKQKTGLVRKMKVRFAMRVTIKQPFPLETFLKKYKKSK